MIAITGTAPAATGCRGAVGAGRAWPTSPDLPQRRRHEQGRERSTPRGAAFGRRWILP